MIIWLVLFVLLLLLLFLLAITFQKQLYLFFYLLSRSQLTAVQCITWILLPGTIIHELAHFLAATLLRVPTGEFSFMPEIRENNEVKIGSLEIAKTGPLRFALIGLAPIILGLVAISSIDRFLLFPVLQTTFSHPLKPFYYQFFLKQFLLLFLICYLLFAVCNTMFSSKKDLETILFPILLIGLIGGALYLAGIRWSLTAQTSQLIANLFKNLDLVLLGVIVLDSVALLIIKAICRSKTSKLAQACTSTPDELS